MEAPVSLLAQVGRMGKMACLGFVALVAACVPAQGDGPRLGDTGRGALIDKSGDTTLQSMVGVAPRFTQLAYEEGGKTMGYNLFVPPALEKGKKYPLVLFMADASTPGQDVKAPLLQGYGGLVWATPEAQAKNPCYVLVPQFSGVAVNDSYQLSPEAAMVPGLVKAVVAQHAVDPARLYVTGQSMGGMIAMQLASATPDLFAASLFVDSHWDSAKFDALVQRPFIFVYAGDQGKAYKNVEPIEDAARRMKKSYTWSEWSAALPLATQDELAATQLGKGQPINLIGFENGTVVPAGAAGSEHMYAFDCAYRLAPLREWLFRQTLGKASR